MRDTVCFFVVCEHLLVCSCWLDLHSIRSKMLCMLEVASFVDNHGCAKSLDLVQAGSSTSMMAFFL